MLSPFCHLWGQQDPQKLDSLSYDKIERLAEKRKITRWMYDLVFVDPEPATASRSPEDTLKPDSLLVLEGKIIRAIHIYVHDPFETHLRDHDINPENLLFNAGNRLHVRTQRSTIRNLLLFSDQEPFDLLLYEESARLVRSRQYLREVKFDVLAVAADSVDIMISVWDNWTIIPQATASTSHLELRLKDNNFAGLGHAFKVGSRWNFNDGSNISRFDYQVPNIGNSYINAGFHYAFSGSTNVEQRLQVTRELFSPLAKWGGGLLIEKNYTSTKAILQDSVLELESKTHRDDFWLIKSWKLLSGNSVTARTSNLIVSARYLGLRYPGKPAGSQQANVFNDQQTVFIGLGFASRRYVKDRYLFDYGKIEDVPAGRIAGLTFAYDRRTTARWYGGARYTWGNYNRSGFVSANVEFGTFYAKGHFEQGVLRGSFTYFTPLMEYGRWHFRQFIKPEFIIGFNRKPTDLLSFSQSMADFENYQYQGKHTLAVTLQLQTYAPYNFLGFRFGPFFFTSFGMLGDDDTGFRRSRLHAMIGIGTLVKNDYLIFNNFQFSLSYFPTLPGSGDHQFRFSSYETDDFRLTGIEISRPDFVRY